MILKIKEKGKPVAVLEAAIVREAGPQPETGNCIHYKIYTPQGPVFTLDADYNVPEAICQSLDAKYVELDGKNFRMYQ